MYLSITGAELILWLHVLAACVWIGGQATLALLTPTLRADRTLLRAAAHRFQLAAWIAFAVLVITGVANMHNAGITASSLGSSPTGRTLGIKLLFVLLSGAAAAIHALVVAPSASGSRRARALSGLLGTASLLTAALAALFGVVIAQQ